MSGLKIPKHKGMSIGEVKIYNKPKIVYIPLISGGDNNITVLVKKDDYVLKGSVLGKRKGNFHGSIFSSVSGTVTGFEEKISSSLESVKCVVIENDFKERTDKSFSHEQLRDISKEEFLSTLENCGIVGMGGAGFPSYIKYSTEANIHTLLINGVECEPYITADYTIIQEKCEEILETIDAILDICGIDQAVLAIKSTNSTLNSVINQYIGTYLKIKLVHVPNLYPMGWEKRLIEEIFHVSYDRLPSEQGIVVNNVSTIYAIYEALKFGKPLTERIVTFSGEGMKQASNVFVKTGTLASEVIEFLGGYDSDFLIAGGPMMGACVPDLVISPEVNCVLALPSRKEAEETTCLRCGKCISVCPANICPVLIKDSLESVSKLKELNVSKCIGCGLCSYVCPAKINVRECVKKAKSVLKERG